MHMKRPALMMTHRLLLVLGLASASLLILPPGSAQEPPAAPKVIVQSDGTVEVPAQTVPMSAFLSPEAKAYVTQHLIDMQNPEILKQDAGVPRFMKGYLARDYQLFAVDKKDQKVGGVHAFVYTPKSGVSAKNKDRVLINLHGGGFSGCWPACAELESIPVSALGGIEVVSVDYREGPDHKFPAASEDVAAVYQELLKTYKPQNIGIYGCSAGGMQTAMSLAWFQKHSTACPRGGRNLLCVGGRYFRRRCAVHSGSAGRSAIVPAHASRSASTLELLQRYRSEGPAGVARQLAGSSREVSSDADDYRHAGF